MALSLAYVTSVISLLFAATVLNQYLTRRKPYQLVWAVGLLLYCAATFLWFLRETFGLNQVMFRLWYFTGAMLVPAYLGTGTLYLLVPRGVGVARERWGAWWRRVYATLRLAAIKRAWTGIPWGRWWQRVYAAVQGWWPKGIANTIMALLLIATVLALILVFVAGLRQPLANLGPAEPLTSKDPVMGGSFFPAYVVVLTILLNVYGTIALVGGAVWSAWVLLRRELPLLRAVPAEAAPESPEVGESPEEERPLGLWTRLSATLGKGYRSVLVTGKTLWDNRAFWRRGPTPQRAVSNILIAVGALIPGIGGILEAFNVPQPHLVTLLVGVLIIYAGFLASTEVFEFYPIPPREAWRVPAWIRLRVPFLKGKEGDS